MVVFLVAAALLTAYFTFLRDHRRTAPADHAASGRVGVAVFPFTPATGKDDLAWYGEAVAEFIPLALEASPGLRVLTRERIHDLAGGTFPPSAGAQLELAKKGKVDYLLRGEVAGGAQGVTLNALWIEAASGRELNRWVLEGVSPENLGRKLDDLFGRLRSALNLPAPAPSEPSIRSLVPAKEASLRSYVDASEALARGDPSGCLQKLGEALKLTDFHLAYYLEAYAAAQLGDPRTAAPAASRVARVTRPLPVRVTLLAPAIYALYASGNPRSAVAPLESFLARFPDEKHPLTWLGAIEVLLIREPEAARGRLKKALALDPSKQETRRLLGEAHLRSGHPDEAVPVLEAYLRARSGDDGARLLLADAYRRLEKRQEARGLAGQILSRRPEDLKATELLGNLFLAEGKAQGARDAYGRLARSTQPLVQAEGEILTGRSFLLEGRFQEGLRRYTLAVERAARSGDAGAHARQLMALGELQASLGRHREALESFSKAREIQPDVGAELSMINVMVVQKQFDQARKMLQEQTSRWEGKISPALLGRLRESLEGTIALEEGKFTEAVSRLSAAARVDGENPHGSEALGRACLGAGDNARAEEIFESIARDPNRYADPLRYVRSLMRLGEAREGLGKKAEALQAYQEALKWWEEPDLVLPETAKTRDAVRRLGR